MTKAEKEITLQVRRDSGHIYLTASDGEGRRVDIVSAPNGVGMQSDKISLGEVAEALAGAETEPETEPKTEPETTDKTGGGDE